MAKSISKNSASQTLPNKQKKEAPRPLETGGISNRDASMEDLFISSLKESYWSENHLVKAIPKMIAAASSPALKKALTEHLKITKTHAARLEKILELLGEKIVARKCSACEGLTISGENVIDSTAAGSKVRDTGIIMSGLKVENFEITTYKGLIQLATSLGKNDVIAQLQQTLDEEIEASEILEVMSQPSRK